MARLETDKILDNLNFGNPHSWQKQTILQNFNPLSSTLDDFVSFCEQLEQADTVHDSNNNTNTNKSTKTSTTMTAGGKSKRKRGGLDCLLHTTHDCRTLKAQANSVKATWNAQTRYGKKKLKEKHGLNALIAEAVDNSVAATKKKRCTARCEVDQCV